MFKLKAVISTFTLAVLLSGTAHASNNVTEAYSFCKTAVKEKYGDETRISMKGSKRFAGTLTVKLSVVPAGEARQRMLCKIDASKASNNLMLTDRKGNAL
ncbi:hypothetical protein N9W66_03610 [Luminiphilus sp.]|jgi:hypothetical protein|nr:hypothetical protein [bacterium]MDA9950901.1 hypothetical protein [Luminiphilus sp.]MDB2433209.1 hypothetical protein [Luminiphilus sp.]